MSHLCCLFVAVAVTMADFLDTLLSSILLICATLTLLLLLYILACRIKFRRKAPKTKRPTVIAFFHPYCSAGGGGERVLWKAIQVLGDLHGQGLSLEVVIYTIDEPKASYKAGRCLVLACAVWRVNLLSHFRHA